jgi:hypothetical protein
MGQVSTEQVVAIIDAVQPDTVVQQAPQVSPWWWSMLLVIIPVILAPFVATWVQRRKKK